MFWYVKIFCIHKECFFLEVLDSSDRSLSLKNCKVLSHPAGQKRSLSTWLLPFIPSAFAQTFLKIGFFHHLNFVLSYTCESSDLDIKSPLTYLPAASQSSWTSQGSLQATRPYVILLSHTSLSFPARHQTYSVREEQLKRMLLHKGLPSVLIPHSTDMAIYWRALVKWTIMQINSETTILNQ